MGEAMTKRLISAFPLLLIGLPGIASAADLSAPVYKAPPVAPAPYYNWNGFYIGANIGGGFGNLNFGNLVTATGVPLAGNSANVSGVLGGGQIGYNFMMSPNFLIGIEADVDGANINGSATNATGSTEHSFNTDVFGTVRGRFGLTSNNWLFYGTGGFAWGNEQVTRNQLTGTTGAAGPGTSEQVSNTGTGWTVGGGIEWGITQNWTARVEYLYVDLGNSPYAFPLSGRTTTFENAFNVVRAGVNFKF
jgi:outer membrane immunogenic protein